MSTIRYELNDNTVSTFNARRRNFGQLRVNERYFRSNTEGLCQFIEGHSVSEDFPCIAMTTNSPMLLFSSSVLEYFVSHPQQCDLLQYESECHSVFLYTHLRHILDLSTTSRKKSKQLKDLVLLPSTQVHARKFLALNEFCKSMFVSRSAYQQQGLEDMSYNDYSLYYALQAIIDDINYSKPSAPQRIILLTMTDQAPFPSELVTSSSHVSYDTMSLSQYLTFLCIRKCIDEQSKDMYISQIQSYLDNCSNSALIPIMGGKGSISYNEHITWSQFLSNMKSAKTLNNSKVSMGIGRLYVDKHDRNHADIRPLGVDEMTMLGLSSRDVDIHADLYVTVRNKTDMNRAMDGDIVSFTVLQSNSNGRESEEIALPSHLNRSLSATDQVDLEVDSDDDTDRATLEERQQSILVKSGDALLQKYGCRAVSVSSIVQRHTDHYTIVALFPHNNNTQSIPPPSGKRATEEMVLVRPLNKAYQFIRVRTRYRAKYSGCYVLVCFDHWPMDSDFPEGHITKVITAVGDGSTEKSKKYIYNGIDLSMWSHHIEAMMSQYSIQQRAFSHGARAALPPLPSLSIESGNSAGNNSKSNDKGDILEWRPDTAEVAKRLDLRSTRRIFSVDPIGCQDIDDAMHVQWITARDLPYAPIHGTSDAGDVAFLELGIHIADVTHFVSADSSLDKEACSRGTTVYLSHQRIDMLPAVLSGNVCSLHSQVDRYAVTTLFHLIVKDKSGNTIPLSIVKKWSPQDILSKYDNSEIVLTGIYTSPVHFGRSLIHSTASMTYEQGHTLVHGSGRKDPGSTSSDRSTAGCSVSSTLWPALSVDLAWLTIISRQCNVTRMQQAIGGLDLSVNTSTQLKFSFASKADSLHMDPSSEETGPSDLSSSSSNDGSNNLSVSEDRLLRTITISSDDHLEIHDTIAELMVLTNSSVAKYIYDHKDDGNDDDSSDSSGSAMIRIHGAPDKVRLEQIQAFCDALYATHTKKNTNGDNSDHFLLLFPPVESATEVLQQLKTYRHKLYIAKSRGLVNDETIDYITSMIIRAMNEAQYVGSANVTPLDAATTDNSNTSSTGQSASTLKSMVHVGLGLQYYTHFTSPIRRYADVIVHRQLLHILDSNRIHHKTGSKNVGMSALENDLVRMQLPASQAKDILDSKKKENGASLDSGSLAVVGEGEFPSLGSHTNDQQDEGEKEEEEEDCDDGSDDDDFLDALLESVGGELLPDTANNDDDDSNGNVDKNAKSIEREVTTSSEPQQSSETIVPRKTRSHLSLRKQYIASVTSHLNTKNRNARLIQREMSKLFVKIYFHHLYLQSIRSNGESNGNGSNSSSSGGGGKGYEVCFGIIYSCLDNGLLVYLPKYDHRGPVYLKNRAGILHLHSSLLHTLPSRVVDIFRSTAQGVVNTQVFDSLIVDNQGPMAAEDMEANLVSESRGKGGGDENEEIYNSTAAVLSIQPKADANKSDSDGESIILRPMQHVLVQVSSAISIRGQEDVVLNRFGAVPELALSLLYAAPVDMDLSVQSSNQDKGGKDNTSNTTSTITSKGKGKEKSKRSTKACSGDRGDIRPEFTAKREPKAGKRKGSLYELLQRFQTQSGDTNHGVDGASTTTATTVKSSGALLERVHAKQRRHQPPSKGAGRIFYGKAGQRPALFDPPLNPNNQPLTGTVNEEDIKQTTNSREAAYNKLKQYGEEWDEEELPSNYGGGGGDGGKAPLGGGHYLDPQGLGGVNRKDVTQAQSRINKVKTAKRNAKYK